MEFTVCRDSSSDGRAIDVSALSDVDLVERMAELGRQRSQVDGQLAAAAAEMHRRTGGRGAAAVMRERLKMSARQAIAEVELAASLATQFPATLDAMCSGEITPGHARVIARVAADPEHADEPALLEMARGYPVDMFARMTRHYMSPGASAEQRRRQRENRWASLVQDPDGSWRLSACFDHDTGKHVSVALNQMVRSYRNGERNSGRQVNSQQRRADALANLITGAGLHLRPKVTLLMIADYDTVARQLKHLRYDDGVPVAPDRIAKLAAEAKILPAIFNAEGDPLWLGRSQRDASAGQRIVLAARDGGCANCAAPAEGGEPHHIEWFSRGGPTDIDNLALLCERCHHLVHDDGWQLHRCNGHYTLRPPTGPSPGPAVPPDSQRNPILRT